MQVSLSRNSWHSQFYRWVVGYYPTYEFKSLCPYFWTILFYLLCSPLILIWKGIMGTIKLFSKSKIVKRKNTKPKKEPSKLSQWYDKNDKKIGDWIGYFWLGIMLLMLLIVIVGSFIDSLGKNGLWMTLVYTFSIIGALVTSFFVIWGIITIFETETWRMIKGMSYSIKNKVCPMIEWKTDESTELS